MRSLVVAAFLCAIAWWSPSSAQPFHPAIESVNPGDLISVSDQESADAMRASLTEQIFGQDFCGCALVPYHFSTFNPAGTVWAGSANMASIQEWRVTVSKGVVSRFYRFTPTTYRNPTSGKGGFIIAAGHGHIGTYQPYLPLIKSLVAAGFEVWTVDMPISGLNAAPTVYGPSGPVTLTSHDQLGSVMSPTYHPLRMFLEPVLAIVNDFEARGITNIGMAGLSGGGWTVDLYAALDPRVDASYSVAGSMPDYARPYTPPHNSTGDWEQQIVASLGADYMDLYILASIGAGRFHANIHIVADDCCFGGYVANHYAPTVSAVVAAIGTGGYAVAFDTSVSTHTISAWTASWIMSDVTSRL